MRGFLSVDGIEFEVPVEGPVEIYREPGQSQEVVARTDNRAYALGLGDATVSRLDEGTPPVVVKPYQSSIAIQNRGNANAVTVRHNGGFTELDTGETTTVTGNAEIAVGYQTTLELEIEEQLSRPYLAEKLAALLVRAALDGPEMAIQRAEEVSEFLAEYPVDDRAYSETRDEIDSLIKQLSTIPTGKELGDERIERIERIAAKFRRLYARTQSQ